MFATDGRRIESGAQRRPISDVNATACANSNVCVLGEHVRKLTSCQE